MTWTSTSVPYITAPNAGEPDAWTKSGGSQRLLGVDVVDASDEVRAALQLPASAQVVRRSRLIIDADGPMEVATSYWPAEWAAGTPLAGPRPVKGGTLRALLDLGYEAAISVEDVTAEVADGLNVPEAPVGVALLVIKRTMFNVAEQPFEHIAMYRWNGDPQRYVLRTG